MAIRAEHPPDRAPSASYSDDLGTTLGWLAAVSSSSDATSLPRMSFSDLMMTVQFSESSSGRAPDSFLDSLFAYVIVSPDFDLAFGGSLLANLIRLYRLHLSDLSNPVPGPFQGGDSIVPFLYRLVASSGASPLITSGAGAVRHGGILDVAEFGLGSSLLPSGSFLPHAPAVAPLPPSVALIPSSFLFVSAPAGFPSSSFASSLPHISSLAPTFPFSSPSVTSIASSLPSPAPPGSPLAPPFHPLAPPVGLRHPVHSLAPLVALYLFPVSSLLPSGPAASSPFLPSCAPAPAAPFLRTPVAASSSSFPFVSASSADTVVSWSLPTIVSCSAPSLSSLTAPIPSLPPPPPRWFRWVLLLVLLLLLLLFFPHFLSSLRLHLLLIPLSSPLVLLVFLPLLLASWRVLALPLQGMCLPLPSVAPFSILLAPLVPRILTMMRSCTVGLMTPW